MKKKTIIGSAIIKTVILLFGIVFVLLSISTLCGCSFEDESKVASYNISKEADNFKVYRKLTIINNDSDKTLLEFEGWASINVDSTDSQLEITYKVGEDEYYKDFVGLNNHVTYLVTQVDGSDVDKYHYEWTYHSEGDLIPIEAKDMD